MFSKVSSIRPSASMQRNIVRSLLASTGSVPHVRGISNDMAPNIVLYTFGTPNGRKISITLEALGLPYEWKQLSLAENEQKQPWFLDINPNGRIPALTDVLPDGKAVRLFESGSMIQYLVAEYDKDHKISFPPATAEYYEMNNWLFFQNANIGPIQEQLNHFYRYAPEKMPYSIERFAEEARRLYGTLERHFSSSGHNFLVGDKFTIADITIWTWVLGAPWSGIDVAEFPALKRWFDRCWSCPGVEKGEKIPNSVDLELYKDAARMEALAAEIRARRAKAAQEAAGKT